MTFSGWSGTGCVASSVAHIRQFCVLTYPVRWKWGLSVHKIFHGQSLLLPGQKEEISAHGQFCRDSIAGCFVQFSASCSLACPMFWQFLVHCTVAQPPPVMLCSFLQLPSNALSFSLYQVAHQTSLSFWIFALFVLDPWHSLNQRFFYNFQCPKFCPATLAQSSFL